MCTPLDRYGHFLYAQRKEHQQFITSILVYCLQITHRHYASTVSELKKKNTSPTWAGGNLPKRFKRSYWEKEAGAGGACIQRRPHQWTESYAESALQNCTWNLLCRVRKKVQRHQITSALNRLFVSSKVLHMGHFNSSNKVSQFFSLFLLKNKNHMNPTISLFCAFLFKVYSTLRFSKRTTQITTISNIHNATFLDVFIEQLHWRRYLC